MNPEIKARWVADLRSGLFEQGTSGLCDGDRYCCLGVLMEQAVEAGICIRNASGTVGVTYGPTFTRYALSPEVREWADLSSTAPVVRVGDRQWNPDRDGDAMIDGGFDLTYANDQLNWTFDEIADAIEESL